MESCCSCKRKQEIDKKTNKLNFVISHLKGGSFCPDCVSKHADKLFPPKKEESIKNPKDPRREQIRTNSSSMVSHNTVMLFSVVQPKPTPKKKEQKQKQKIKL